MLTKIRSFFLIRSAARWPDRVLELDVQEGCGGARAAVVNAAARRSPRVRLRTSAPLGLQSALGRRADALGRIAESFLQHGAEALSSGDRQQIVVPVRRSEGRIDRGLWWSDAAFYGVLASTAAFVALINLYAREAKWRDPKTLSGALWPVLGPGLLQYTCNRFQAYLSCDWLTVLFVVPAPLLWVRLLHRVFARAVGVRKRRIAGTGAR